MAKEGADIFMIFKEQLKPLPGECTTELRSAGGTKNDLLNGFSARWMFEITKFNFGVGANQEDVGEFEYPGLKADRAVLAALAAENARLAKEAKAIAKGRVVKVRGPSKPGQTVDNTPVTIQPVSFSRKMDTSSSLLLLHTIKRTYFNRVAIVKRKSSGGVAAGEAYLRLDFEGVILIEANWSNDDPIEESYTLHARTITMRYKPQLPDGSLGSAKVGFWSMVPNATEAKL